MRKALGYRLWALGLLLAGAVSAEQYVLPGRADLDTYHFDKTSLPYSTWTNTTQWLVDETRVDFSPDHVAAPGVTGVRCLSFDASSCWIDLNVLPDSIMESGEFDISFFLNWNSAHTTYMRTLQFNEATGFFRLQKDPGNNSFTLWCRKASGQNLFIVSANITADEWHFVEVTGNGSTAAIYVDGNEEASTSIDTNNFYSPTWGTVRFSDDSSSYSVNGLVSTFNLAEPAQNLPLQEGGGSTLYDVSGTSSVPNHNDGTVSGALWVVATNTANNVNHLRGFYTSDGSAPFIPALLDGSGKDTQGNDLSDPPTVHNGAECSLVLADGSTNTYAQLLALPGTKTNANGAITSLYLTN